MDTITTGSSDSSMVTDRITSSFTEKIPYWGSQINGHSRDLDEGTPEFTGKYYLGSTLITSCLSV